MARSIDNYVLEWLKSEDSGKRVAAAGRLGSVGSRSAFGHLSACILSERDNWTLAGLLDVVLDSFPGEASKLFQQILQASEDPMLIFTTMLVANNAQLFVKPKVLRLLLRLPDWYVRLITAKYVVRMLVAEDVGSVLEQLLIDLDDVKPHPAKKVCMIGDGSDVLHNLSEARALVLQLQGELLSRKSPLY